MPSAAVSGGAPVAGQRRHRCEIIASDTSTVLGRIRKYYKKALDRLPPSLLPRVHEAGVCFGFLDPVSNIIANAVSYEASPEEKDQTSQEPGQERQGKKRRISQPAGTSSKSEEATPQREAAMPVISSSEASSIAARSLQGLVTFLTRYFRYLQTWEALHYLRLSRADLLVAVHLVEEDRATHGFSAGHPTTKTALACAALSAKHPQPATLVSSSLSLASRQEEVRALLATRRRRLRVRTARRLAEICAEGVWRAAEPREPMLLAAPQGRHRRLPGSTMSSP